MWPEKRTMEHPSEWLMRRLKTTTEDDFFLLLLLLLMAFTTKRNVITTYCYARFLEHLEGSRRLYLSPTAEWQWKVCSKRQKCLLKTTNVLNVTKDKIRYFHYSSHHGELWICKNPVCAGFTKSSAGCTVWRNDMQCLSFTHLVDQSFSERAP